MGFFGFVVFFLCVFSPDCYLVVCTCWIVKMSQACKQREALPLREQRLCKPERSSWSEAFFFCSFQDHVFEVTLNHFQL